ncbi:MAG: nitrile hydratase accessory protein [Thermoleophilia bacterium]|nr:nitrile hydratase accessory protein [Thermoleophilia bacterium]
MAGSSALPRRNGELVFSAPWESRAFGVAVSLCQEGVYEWDDFRSLLIDEIAAHEPEDGEHYYQRWFASLERLLLDREVVTEAELTARYAEFEADVEAEHGHEHEHDHTDERRST